MSIAMRSLANLLLAASATALPLAPGQSKLSLTASVPAAVAQAVPDSYGHITSPEVSAQAQALAGSHRGLLASVPPGVR